MEKIELTGEEEAGLRELGEELRTARRSPWQPRAVAKVFWGRRRRLTMQGWIDLDWAKSPLLKGEYPRTMEEIDEAFRAFGEEWAGLTPGETVERLGRMKEAVEEGFGAVMAMSPPDGPGREGAGEAGMGNWLPMIACLVGEMGIAPAEALGLPVGQAFALIAALRGNQGWMPRGESYVEREI